MSEHWVNKISCNYIKVNGYKLISAYGRTNQKRGGVCILAKSNLGLESVLYNGSIESDFEATVAYGTIDNKKVVIACLYRTPNSNYDLFLNKFNELLNYMQRYGEILIVCGDTNVNLLNESKEKKQMLNMLLENNLHQTIHSATRTTTQSATCIDNIFANIRAYHTHVEETQLSDHTFQIAFFKVGIMEEESNKEKRTFSQQNKELFLKSIATANWNKVYGEDDADHAYNEFLEEFRRHFDFAFPKVQYTEKTKQSNKKQWITPEIREMTAMVREMVPIEKRLGSAMYTERYKNLKKLCSTMTKNAKKTFNDNRITQAPNTNRECWKIINEHRKNENETLPKKITVNATTTRDPRIICNTLNDFFTNIKTTQPSKTIAVDRQMSSFFLWPVSENEVSKSITRHCRKTSAGYDDIPGTIVKLVKDTICSPMAYIVNLCFKNGKFPDKLKISKVIPAYKQKGSKDDVANYRPLAIQCQFSKIIESCYHRQLYKYVDKYNIIAEQQHGYRKARSTTTAIYEAVKTILDGMNNKQKVAGIFLDMSRAFDSVNHVLLLNKMEAIGIRGVPLDFLRSYLDGRGQVVTWNGFTSEYKETTIGLPQGTIISPLLFSIMINDLPTVCTAANKIIIYADDSNMIISETIKENLVARSREAVNEMHKWCLNNGIILNINKTQLMQFLPANLSAQESMLVQINGKSIKQINTTKFLGLNIDHKLRWNVHTEYLEAKLSSLCYLIKTIRPTVTDRVVQLMYYALVQSVLAYGIIFWALAAETSQLMILQKKILRIMEGANTRAHCKPIFKKRRILTLQSLYIFNVVMWMKDREGSITRNKEIHDYPTRAREDIHPRFQRLAVAQDGPEYMGAKLFNCLPLNIRQIKNREKFRRQLLDHLLENPYYNINEYLEQHS